jgi:CRISPR system Cascade subunit CasE
MTWIVSVPMSHPTFEPGRWQDLDWVHRCVMALFADIAGDSARASSATLFRVEPAVRGGRVLVQSSERPSAPGLSVASLDGVLDKLTTGTQVRVLAKVNPVRTVNRTGADGTVRTHRAIVGADLLPSWFAGRLTGFELCGDPQIVTTYERFKKTPLYTVTLSGRASITDPDAARNVVVHGVGKARSYGCGLVSVLPE